MSFDGHQSVMRGNWKALRKYRAGDAYEEDYNVLV